MRRKVLELKDKPMKWLIGVAAVSCVVWMGGLAWTLVDYWGGSSAASMEEAAPAMEAVEPEPAADDGKFRLLALGDSLTKGTGDPDGKGYVGYLLDSLEERSEQEIISKNYGVDGYTSGQLASLLMQTEVQAEVEAADAIVISIGGNDLFQGGETLGNLDPANIEQIEDKYLSQLATILKRLRELNQGAGLFLIGLYNPFIELQDTETTTKIVRDWNYETAELAAGYPETVLVPTLDLFQLNMEDYLARDLFHPNAEGYRLMGDRVASLMMDLGGGI